MFFTMINLVLLLSLVWIHNPFYTDIVRTTTFICFAASVATWIAGKVKETYHALFIAFFPPIDEHAEQFIMFCGDILMHFLPFIVLGLPSIPLAILIGYGILFLWYYLVRPRLHTMYPSVNRDWTVVMVTLMGLMVLIGACQNLKNLSF